MKKNSRDYKNMFAAGSELPSPEEVGEQVAKLTGKSTAPDKAAKRGRKPLETPRSPYTTSLSDELRFQLKYHAMKRGVRPSDLLEQILAGYFAKENKQ
jgi:hypothetical protein